MNILEAVVSGNLTELENQLKSRPALDHLIDGKTLLHRAVEKNLLGVVTRLLQAGANPDIREEQNQATALLSASFMKNHLIVQALINADAALDTQSNAGNTALTYAAGNNDIATLNLLLAAGANPDIQNGDGITALYNATQKKNNATIKALLDAGANPDIQCSDGQTALHCATWNDNEEAVKALIAAKANPHIQNGSGRKASGIATIPVIRVLLDRYDKEWTPPAEKPRPVIAARRRAPKAENSGGISIQTQDNIARLEKMVARRRNPGDQTGPADDSGTENQEIPDAWQKISETAVARTSDYAIASYLLTEIFDFRTRQQLSITRNLETGAECMALREFDALQDRTTLSDAFNAFAKAGGKADPRVIEKGHVVRRMEPLMPARKTAPSAGSGDGP